ncbi:MAG: sigma-70 family RNA polymerase sigma factor [Faecalicatena sp.]|uniref:sigma-70 family RNA polymerase sigma factor n=1 Tax=Faecalicatena sp. TaxID=2005360 RepID=UPI00258A0EE6|nr:sigma-70 family RNA polymerase sigma factor [Faecalicatena sp.]MCI6465573.1 sigma-70 family RNA polymerase sigma factor [Faecalicatena sp.]MDY5617405.1 sigma-70 family RNA polymerase sigma factor [Lachnospiraceae bacterium]
MEIIDTSTDIRLVKKAIRGSIDAYGELIEIHKNYLYRMAYLHSGTEDAALEIVQETILKGFHSIKTLRNPELFRSWITRILIHISIDFHRKSVPSIQIDENLPETRSLGISIEERLDLYEAIRQLPEKYRLVIVLKYFDDLKQDEIAGIMNIPRGTVAAYLTRARKELRRSLKEGYLNG